MRHALFVTFGTFSILLSLAAGCSSDRVATVEEPSQNTAIPVDELLDNVVRAYRNGTRYEDKATIELSYRDGDQRVSDKADISVSFARPNRLALRAYKSVVYCDGRRFQARIRDEGTRDLDGQILDRPAPAQLSVADFASDKILLQQLSSAVLANDQGRLPPQLELLLGDDGWRLLTDSTLARKIVGEEPLSGANCLKVEIDAPVGVHFVWIDPAYYTVRKIEFPREALQPELAQAEHLQDVKLTAEFHEAVLDYPGRMRQRRSPIPDGGRRVRYFVPPPQPLPSELFGKPAGEFALQTLEGRPVARQSFHGKPAVLMWFHEHPACQTALQQLEAVFQKDKSATVYGVCTEPSTVDSSHIESFLRDWNVTLPVVRDLEAYGRDLFHFQGSPALLVLDAAGIVQIVEVGANPQLSEELPAILERLTKGEDVAAEVLAKDAAERRRYEQELAVASGEQPPAPQAESPGIDANAAAAAPQFVPAAGPKRLKRTSRWSIQGFTELGGLIAVQGAGGRARLFVIEAGRTLIELSPTGKELERRPLAIPADARAERARFWPLGEGAGRWAIAARQPPRVFLLDEQGALIASPIVPAAAAGDASSQTAPEIEWLDRTGSGAPELVVRAPSGPGGVAPLAWFGIDGQMLAPTASLPREASWLAVAPPLPAAGGKAGWSFWFGDERGRAQRLSASGQLEPLEEVRDWRLQHVIAAGFPPESASKAAGLAANSMGRTALVAFDERFRQAWNYPLPARPRESPWEPIRAALLFVEREPFWVLTAADGTVHLISADGSFSDYFALGEAATGLATLRYDGDALIITATAHEATAWSFERP
ncbi:MAG: TlpA disulfide reductase family protein [Pirellulales bacterium]